MSEDTRSEWAKRIGVGERQFVYGRKAGSTEVVPVTNENTGKIGGEHLKHWDGSVSAVVRPEPIKAKFHMSAKYYKEVEYK